MHDSVHQGRMQVGLTYWLWLDNEDVIGEQKRGENMLAQLKQRYDYAIFQLSVFLKQLNCDQLVIISAI